MFAHLVKLFNRTIKMAESVVLQQKSVPAPTSRRVFDSQMVWVDCEMTGLEVEKHRLVEIACIITDAELKVIDEIGPFAIRQPPEVLDDMTDWCKQTFKKNGLLNRIKQSESSEKEVEQKVLNFLKKHTKPGECPIAGNSVYMDRLFLNKYMPLVANHLHYRTVDVSSIKELIKRWYSPKEIDSIPEKKMNHLALDDIHESIEELRYYRKNFFK